MTPARLPFARSCSSNGVTPRTCSKNNYMLIMKKKLACATGFSANISSMRLAEGMMGSSSTHGLHQCETVDPIEPRELKWLVVYLPLWKIWVRQWEGLSHIWNGKYKIYQHVRNHQPGLNDSSQKKLCIHRHFLIILLSGIPQGVSWPKKTRCEHRKPTMRGTPMMKRWFGDSPYATKGRLHHIKSC